jgi:integrase
MLVEYIAERAQVHCPSTVARRVVGIGRAHVAHGIPDPSKDELVRRVLRGVRRAHGTGQRQAAPLLMEDLLAGISRLPDDLRGARDRALLLIGFAAGMRRSELVGLDVEDLAFVDAGVFIRLRRSKTDQEGCGRTIAIPYGRTAACPVLALKHWLAVIGIRSGAVFLALNRGNALPGHRLGDQSVSRVVKEFVLLLGKAPAAYSGHSLRAGFVTSAAQAGADFLMIQQQTGHRSIAMLSRYLRTVNPFEGNAARGLL